MARESFPREALLHCLCQLSHSPIKQILKCSQPSHFSQHPLHTLKALVTCPMCLLLPQHWGTGTQSPVSSFSSVFCRLSQSACFSLLSKFPLPSTFAHKLFCSLDAPLCHLCNSQFPQFPYSQPRKKFQCQQLYISQEDEQGCQRAQWKHNWQCKGTTAAPQPLPGHRQLCDLALPQHSLATSSIKSTRTLHTRTRTEPAAVWNPGSCHLWNSLYYRQIKNKLSNYQHRNLPHGKTITPDLARPFPNIFLKLFSWYGLRTAVGFRSILISGFTESFLKSYSASKGYSKWIQRFWSSSIISWTGNKASVDKFFTSQLFSFSLRTRLHSTKWSYIYFLPLWRAKVYSTNFSCDCPTCLNILNSS